MKRKTIGFLLAALMLSVLVVPAAAAGTEMQNLAGGFYDIGTAAGVTITPKDSENADVPAKSVKVTDAFKPYYPGSVKLDVTVSGVDTSKQYAIFLADKNTSSTVPTVSDTIYYIDQTTGTIHFTVYPMLPETSKDMTLYITAADFATIRIPVSYAIAKTYEVQLYTLGDVDNINGINATDASLVLQAVVNKITLTDTQKLAADVDLKSGVNATDASYILQYVVHKITDFSEVQ